MQALKASVLLLGAAAAAAAASAATVAAFSVREGVASESWLGHVPDSTPLCELVLPGTHDAAAYDLGIPVGRELVVTQSSNLTEQLARGVRYVDLRVGVCAGTTDKLCMYHGDVYLRLNFDSALAMVAQFLETHPSETVVMRLQRERDQGLDDFRGFVEANYLAKNPAIWYAGASTKAAADVTLGDARGKILLFWSSGTTTSRFGYDYGVVDSRAAFEFDSLDAMSDTFTQRAQRSGVVGWFENPTSGLVYFTLFGERWFAPNAIDTTAAKMLARVATILAATPMEKGIVSMDFPTDALITTLVGFSLDRFPRRLRA